METNLIVKRNHKKLYSFKILDTNRKYCRLVLKNTKKSMVRHPV